MQPIKSLARSLVTGVLITCLFLTFTPSAQAGGPGADLKITKFDVGFGSKYRVGNWTPVRITLEAKKGCAGRLSVIVPDGDGVPSRVTKDFTLADTGSKTYTLYARFGRVYSDVTVIAEKPEGTGTGTTVYDEVSYRPDEEGPYPPAVSAESSLMVIVGQKSDAVDAAIRATNKATADHTTSTSVSDPSDLPSNWIGYDGIDTLLLPLSNRSVAEMLFTPDDPRTRAIDRWVRQGGHLVLFGGKVDPKLTEELAKAKYDSATLLLPGQPVGMTTLDRVVLLETYIDTHATIPLPPGQRQHRLPVFELSEPQGTIEVHSGKLPLIVKNVHGFGTVTFLAVDPSVAPLDKWRDRGQMMVKLLGMPDQGADLSESSGGAVQHLGFTDLSGQMRSALDRFDGVTIVPFALIVAIMLLYVLLIGPADYFLLKKIGRMSWTWVTFTLIIILFGVGTVWFAYQMKGDQLRLHRIDLVDVDATSGAVRGTSWANLFSPEGKRYDLAFSSDLPDYIKTKDASTASTLFSWLGLPGRGLGGMNPHAAEGSVWRKPYDFAPDYNAMDGVPLLNWSTKSFTARWSAEWSGDFVCKLKKEEELPVGRVTNPLKSQRLEDCLLIYDRWAYRLGTLKPGEAVYVDGVKGRMRLNTLLTGRKMVLDDSEKMREQVTPYETESIDTTDILQVMMFYDVAGGERYVRLSNRYQPFVDLSGLLTPGRAMLVGRLPAEAQAATNFTIDGKPLESDQHTTIFRFIIPVDTK